MKIKHFEKSRAFTLVELLVVIAIIATLATISSVIVLRMKDNAKDVQASTIMKQITMSVEAFKDDYGYAPYAPLGTHPAADQHLSTTGANAVIILKDLMAEETSADANNTRGKLYLTIKDATNELNGIVRDGSNNITSLVDPWGNGYVMSLDYDYDEEITLSTTPWGTLSGTEVKNQVIALGCGGRSKAIDDKKDVVSWK